MAVKEQDINWLQALTVMAILAIPMMLSLFKITPPNESTIVRINTCEVDKILDRDVLLLYREVSELQDKLKDSLDRFLDILLNSLNNEPSDVKFKKAKSYICFAKILLHKDSYLGSDADILSELHCDQLAVLKEIDYLESRVVARSPILKIKVDYKSLSDKSPLSASLSWLSLPLDNRVSSELVYLLRVNEEALRSYEDLIGNYSYIYGYFLFDMYNVLITQALSNPSSSKSNTTNLSIIDKCHRVRYKLFTNCLENRTRSYEFEENGHFEELISGEFIYGTYLLSNMSLDNCGFKGKIDDKEYLFGLAIQGVLHEDPCNYLDRSRVLPPIITLDDLIISFYTFSGIYYGNSSGYPISKKILNYRVRYYSLIEDLFLLDNNSDNLLNIGNYFRKYTMYEQYMKVNSIVKRLLNINRHRIIIHNKSPEFRNTTLYINKIGYINEIFLKIWNKKAWNWTKRLPTWLLFRYKALNFRDPPDPVETKFYGGSPFPSTVVFYYCSEGRLEEYIVYSGFSSSNIIGGD